MARKRRKLPKPPTGHLIAFVRFSEGNTRLVCITSAPPPSAFDFRQFPGDPLPLLEYEVDELVLSQVVTTQITAILRRVVLHAVDGDFAWYTEAVPDGA